jgi:hypothetical protein
MSEQSALQVHVLRYSVLPCGGYQFFSACCSQDACNRCLFSCRTNSNLILFISIFVVVAPNVVECYYFLLKLLPCTVGFFLDVTAQLIAQYNVFVPRIIGPAMPSRELLAAAAEMTEALRCRL